LLIGVGNFDELWFAPSSSQKFQADREPIRREAARNGNGAENIEWRGATPS
jgi:hypothetical protein